MSHGEKLKGRESMPGDQSGLSASFGVETSSNPEPLRHKVRFGVAFRLVAALLAIAVLALMAIVAAIYAFSQFRQGFDRIAKSNVPILIAAGDIAARSQALAANAPNLASADSHFARQAISLALHKQLEGLAQVGEHLKALAPDTRGLDHLIHNQALLTGNLERLDGLVGNRIDADSAAANLMLRLEGLAARVHEASAGQLPTLIQGSSPANVEAFLGWVAATDEAIAVMLSTTTADTATRIARLRADFNRLRDRARAARSDLPSQMSALAPFEAELDKYGYATRNIFDARSAQLASASALLSELLETHQVAAGFVASAEEVLDDVKKSTQEQSEFFASLISRYSTVFILVSVLALAGSAGIFLYIVRSVVLRLRGLSQSMSARIDGHDAPISVSGSDEIAEMGAATQYFVSTIEQRERLLKERTDELAQSVEELRALGEVSRAVNSTIDLETVLSTIVAKAVQLSGAEAGTIWVYDETNREFRMHTSYGMDEALIAGVKDHPIRLGDETVVDQAVLQRMPIQIPDIQKEDPARLLDAIVRAGFRAALTIPLLGVDGIVGALVVRRREPGAFSKNTIDLLQTFGTQSVLAIQNARQSGAMEALSAKLSKYLAPQVYKSIFAGHQDVAIASKRKQLTICFSDIAGFTEITDRMESEALTQLINHYLTEMSVIAEKYGATVDKYVGDAIVMFSGDPESRGVKEDALACVKMAIAMQRRMADLAGYWRNSGIQTPLRCRIGIHTDYCTVGNFGSPDRMDYTMIGGAVNLASRLEHEAPAGSILISYETHAHVRDEIHCEEHGNIRVKGIAYPVTTYRVVDLKANLPPVELPTQTQLPHLKLELEPQLMSDDERAQAEATLRQALDRLQRQ
jgi:class 3 adenylate cyclase